MSTTGSKPSIDQSVAKNSGYFDLEKIPHNPNLLHATIGAVSPDRLFNIRYGIVGGTMSMTTSRPSSSNNWGADQRYFHATSFIQHLIDEYQLDPNYFTGNFLFDTETKKTFYSDVFIDLGDYLSIYLLGGHISSHLDIENPSNLKPDTSDGKFFCFTTVMAYLIPKSISRAEKILAKSLEYQLFIPTERCLLMVCANPNSGFYTSNIKIKQPIIKDFRLNYGDKFPSVHQKLVEQLCKPDSSGITFLHGPPGTGKTYYIRYLINEIKEKNLIYVPPDLVTEITKPGFLPFLMQYPNSILIIEDAENIVLDRKENLNPNQAVSNLLNLSDGLLGDAMHLQIITTFNCQMKAIDPALLREGRLVVEHQFDKLSASDARRLCNELNIEVAESIVEPMSLAEIYAKKS